MFLVSFCIPINCITYPSSNSSKTINNVSISVNSSSFTSVFFKAACHANPAGERNFAGSIL